MVLKVFYYLEIQKSSVEIQSFEGCLIQIYIMY